MLNDDIKEIGPLDEQMRVACEHILGLRAQVQDSQRQLSILKSRLSQWVMYKTTLEQAMWQRPVEAGEEKEGDWHEDKKHDRGKITDANDSVFEGE